MPVPQFKGKIAVENHHWTVPHHTLELDKREYRASPGENCPRWMGNLMALRALLPTHAGRIKCINIDPPYNAGTEGRKWVRKRAGRG